MLELLWLLLTTIFCSLRPRQDLVLENLLLRRQIAVLTRPTRFRPRARLRTWDKLLWGLARRFRAGARTMDRCLHDDRFLEHPQGRIAYDETGPADGQLVVLVPGIGDLRQQYRFLAPTLVDAGYHVVTTNLGGLGESSTGWDDYTGAATGSDVVALLRTLHAGPAGLALPLARAAAGSPADDHQLCGVNGGLAAQALGEGAPMAPRRCDMYICLFSRVDSRCSVAGG